MLSSSGTTLTFRFTDSSVEIAYFSSYSVWASPTRAHASSRTTKASLCLTSSRSRTPKPTGASSGMAKMRRNAGLTLVTVPSRSSVMTPVAMQDRMDSL